MNEALVTWVNNVRKYPPNEIFFEKYGKAAKREESLKQLCDRDLYFFVSNNNTNYLAEMFSTYRELEVLCKLGLHRIKPEAIKEASDKFLAAALSANKALNSLFKKDQLLAAYYKDWSLSNTELKTAVYLTVKDYL